MSNSGSSPRVTEDLIRSAFLRRKSGDWTARDEATLESWLSVPELAEKYRRVEQFWRDTDRFATSPAILKLREEAQARRLRKRQRSWHSIVEHKAWAAVLLAAVALGFAVTAMFMGSDSSVYQTGIGEQRLIDLDDNSRIALDAKTTVEVRFTRDARVVKLSEGQAQFMVAKDSRRPFSVEAGVHTVTAIGTSFNVELEGDTMNVALVEGKVGVTLGVPKSGADAKLVVAAAGRTELTAGQELRVDGTGRSRVIPNADIAAAILWRQGKVVLKDAPLADAVRRINRYSNMQIVVEGPEIEALRISGIFDSGDTQAFIEAIETYLPVAATQERPDLLRLRPTEDQLHSPM
jgi:transmembrane sensor